ncbi:hypothetical protein EMPG_14833, partial [Blastomyces silverae]
FIRITYSQPHLRNPLIGIVLLIFRQLNEMPITYRLRDTEEQVSLAGSLLAVSHGKLDHRSRRLRSEEGSEFALRSQIWQSSHKPWASLYVHVHVHVYAYY